MHLTRQQALHWFTQVSPVQGMWVSPGGHQPLEHAEEDVCVEAALMRLIQHNHRVLTQ